VLSGANFGPWVPPFPAYIPMPENQPGKGIGHFFGAMRIDAFGSADDFKKNMDQWIHRFRNAESTNINQKVIIPGDPEREFESERKINGIELLQDVVDDLKTLGDRFSVTL
jgi:LDH2 family malate/lactate/ureidoglycolate dehydrogenase